ncbi:hypothetical protein IF2G_07974 [Cordyceps javanica]|nr:hypothetical protein IF2G_07974 [Cordyceps javanica]
MPCACASWCPCACRCTSMHLVITCALYPRHHFHTYHPGPDEHGPIQRHHRLPSTTARRSLTGHYRHSNPWSLFRPPSVLTSSWLLSARHPSV